MSNKKQRKKSRKKPGRAGPTNTQSTKTATGRNPTDKNPATSAGRNKSPKHASVLTRRNAIKMLIALPVAGAAGAAIHRYDVQNRGLHDLTLVGQGAPVVVQIHDPKCQQCRRLMNNTRKALKGQENILFRVADITSDDGSLFQRKYHAETVSLLLFNANGEQVDTIQGVTPVDELKRRFNDLY